MLFGPIADAASEKLAAELPDEFVIASELMLLSLPYHVRRDAHTGFKHAKLF